MTSYFSLFASYQNNELSPWNPPKVTNYLKGLLEKNRFFFFFFNLVMCF